MVPRVRTARFCREQLRTFDFGVRGERADGDLAVLFADVAHAAQMADVNDVAGNGKTQLHQRQETVASGEQFGFISVAFDKAQGFVESFWRVIFERCGNHCTLRASLCMSCQIFSRLKGMST